MTKRKTKTTSTQHQANLSDGNGEITAHERYPEVDKLVESMMDARDQVAVWEETRVSARADIQTMLDELGHSGPYFFDHGDDKFKIEIKHTDNLSVTKCKKKEADE